MEGTRYFSFVYVWSGYSVVNSRRFQRKDSELLKHEDKKEKEKTLKYRIVESYLLQD